MAKDSELRGIILQKYYDNRGWGDFVGLGSLIDERIDLDTAFRISMQLGEHHLLFWKPIVASGVRDGSARITAQGVDAIEGAVKPPIAIVYDHRVQISNSSSVQVGTGNTQGVTISGERISIAIDGADASQTEKEEAKSLLQRILDNPLLSKILSGLIGS